MKRVTIYGWVSAAVALVLAENRYIAEDAAARVDIEYEPLPVVSDPRDAAESRVLCHYCIIAHI